jgi:toxin-antitoxin system PIN domain toxin
VRLWDVNLWVYAFRSDSPYHDQAYQEISAGLAGAEPLAFCPHVAASFLRLVTNPRIFRQPSGYAEAWDFIDTIEANHRSRFIDVDAMTFGVFKHLCLVAQAAENQVPNALLAAIAIRHDALFVTKDTGFQTYRGLTLRLLP